MNMKIRRLIFVILWVLSLSAISFYGGVISYSLFWGITLIPVVSAVYLALVYFQLRIFQQIESRNMVGSAPMPYFFVLQNDSLCAFAGISVRLFSSFSMVEDLPGDEEYELLPGDKHVFRTRLTCKYRGEYEVGVKEVIMTDFFRLFRVRYRIPGTIKALVRPRIVRLPGLCGVEGLTALLLRESQRERTEPDILVRDYLPGDALKQIHWKAAAREQKLKVRGRIGEEKQGIALLWDTGRCSQNQREYLPVENKILEAVLALGIFMAERNISFSSYYGQGGLLTFRVESLGDFDGFYEKVSTTRFDRAEDFQGTLLTAVQKGILYQCRVVLCVLRELTQDVWRIVKELDKAGALTVFYVVADEIAEHVQGDERRRIVWIPTQGELEGRL